MQTVLAAVDFSEVTEAVVERAASLARAFSAHLVLLHVAEPDPEFVGFEAGPQSVRDARADELREEHRSLQQRAEELRGQGLDVQASLVPGPTIETIVQRAQQLAADLVVLGSHGHGALHRALLGSVSEGVLRRAGRPVLIIPTRRSGRERA